MAITEKIDPVKELKILLDGNLDIKVALTSSLMIASGRAKQDLDPQLYGGLNEV